jgi:hypothetical protein
VHPSPSPLVMPNIKRQFLRLKILSNNAREFGNCSFALLPRHTVLHIYCFKVMKQQWPFGAIKNLLSISIISSRMHSLNLAPRHCLKKSAVASRSSIIARCKPMHTREPPPKGMYAAFCWADMLALSMKRCPLNLNKVVRPRANSE